MVLSQNQLKLHFNPLNGLSINTLKNSGTIQQVLEEDGTPKKKKCEL